MNPKDFRKKAELCLRLADGLSLNNPARVQLMEQAKDFREHAKELEAQDALQRQQSSSATYTAALPRTNFR
jgi:acetyl-CoA carboxylase beta subunit